MYHRSSCPILASPEVISKDCQTSFRVKTLLKNISKISARFGGHHLFLCVRKHLSGENVLKIRAGILPFPRLISLATSELGQRTGDGWGRVPVAVNTVGALW